MDVEGLRKARIVICDDQESNVVLLERLLEASGYRNLVATTDSSEVVRLCAESPPDLILLDLHMPAPGGYEVLRLLRSALDEPWLPVIVLTADSTPEAKQRALSAGARDFLTKPFDTTEVLLRIENLLEVRSLQAELRHHNAQLERTVAERTRELDEARLEILERLALAAEYRDDMTGEHAQRVGRTAALLSRALGCSEEEVQLIRYAATLHDIGKVAIPDAILLKPGPLTAEEYELMKGHVAVSKPILSGSRSPLLQMTEEIALSHHEKWDGSGYPAGLSGEEIPFRGRIVALADAFDAMTHDRPYKAAGSVDEALAEIRAQSGRHFDPRMVEAFATLDHPRLLTPVEWPAPSALGRAERSRALRA